MEVISDGEDDAVDEVQPSQSPIKRGDSYDSWEQFEEALKNLSQSSHAVFVVKNSKLVSTVNMGLKKKKYDERLKYKSALIACKNYGTYVTKSTGQRPNQQTFKMDCKAHIEVKADLDRQKIVVTSVSLEHNHITEKEITAFYPEVRGLNKFELDDAKKLIKLRVKPSILLQQIHEETGKHLVGQDLVNARHAFKQQEREGRTEVEDLLHYLKVLEDQGDFITVGTDDEGEIQFIFIMHKGSKETFNKFPEVVIADSTYNTNKNKMPLLLINVMNGLGGSECIAYAFIINETKETYSEIFKLLGNAVGDDIKRTKTIVVDHDMSEISSLKEAFPHIDVQLCSFHVPNSFKRNTLKEKNKESVREVLQKMVYCKNDEEYNELYKELKCVASSKFMTNYFDKYYHHCANAWTRKSKHHSPNFGNDTTNRNESMNQKIKVIVDRSFELKETIVQIRAFLRNKQNTMAYRRYLMCAKKSYVVNCNDPDVQNILDICTQFASKYIRLELEQAKKAAVKIIYDTTETSCNCYFAKSLLLPCRHIMRIRASSGLSRFDEKLVHQRWLKSYNTVTTGTVNPENENGKMLVVSMPPKLKPKGKADKFKSGMKLGGELAELLSVSGTEQYERRVAFLKEIISSWKNGQELAVYRLGAPLGEEEDTTTETAQEENLETSDIDQANNLGKTVQEDNINKDNTRAENISEDNTNEDNSQEETEDNTNEDNTLEGNISEDDPMKKIASPTVIKLPQTFKITGKPKDCDRTVFGQATRKWTLPSVKSKGRPKTAMANRLTAIGNKHEDGNLLKIPKPKKGKLQEIPKPKNGNLLKIPKPKKGKYSTSGHDSDSESDVDVKPMIWKKYDGGTIDLVSESESEESFLATKQHKAQSTKQQNEKVSPATQETLNVDTVPLHDMPSSADTPEKDPGMEAQRSMSPLNLSHLLDDENDDIFLGVPTEDNKDNPMCRCRPQLRSVRRISGPKARQPGRHYYVCQKQVNKCDFWRLAASPKKAATKPFAAADFFRAKKAQKISDGDITFNTVDGSYNVCSQTTPNKVYKVTATSCGCPDKQKRKVFECKHIIKIKSLMEGLLSMFFCLPGFAVHWTAERVHFLLVSLEVVGFFFISFIYGVCL
ncbi:uncharacterized protein LOC117650351 isoform X2 [Thrips palmi]|uniref:Uncharacterized protein LOC117650351 isoform X2 n=1 Tax=Thrips palmi TaxID=161013 RepID=A0A6P8ZWW4_THRPL|nr:uncharacterized protein LOC117650351 isoform X2 [Thrips palmi]